MATTHNFTFTSVNMTLTGEIEFDESGSADGLVKLAANTEMAKEWDCALNLIAELRRFDKMCGGLTSISVTAIP